MDYAYDIKIPKERIAVLIGSKGTTKRIIQRETKIKIDVDSQEGIATVSGDDAIGLMTARDIIKAIARGFNPEIALSLLKQDFVFELIELMNIARNKNDMERIRGRIIGTNGKSRELIEDLTETNICVYGKTVAFIGEISKVAIAKEAVMKIIDGSPHSGVYSWLEKQRKLMRLDEFNYHVRDEFKEKYLNSEENKDEESKNKIELDYDETKDKNINSDDSKNEEDNIDDELDEDFEDEN